MGTYCLIENGVVTNRASFEGAMPPDWPGFAAWIADETAQIGWTYANGALSPPAMPAPPPVTAQQVTDETQRRINIAGQAALTNNILMGIAVPADVTTLCNAIRAKGTEIAAMVPIPEDYAADSRWPS